VSDPQNPPPTSRITNRNPLNGRPLTIPTSFTNIVLSIRPGVVNAEQSFQMITSSANPDDAVALTNGLITFNSVIAVPVGANPDEA
jgi:hypothetical protein